MTEDERDFSEWWEKEIIQGGELKERKPRWYYAKLSWLAKSKTLREKEKERERLSKLLIEARMRILKLELILKEVLKDG